MSPPGYLSTMGRRLATAWAWTLRPLIGGALAALCTVAALGMAALWLGVLFALVLLVTEIALKLIRRRIGPDSPAAAVVAFFSPMPPPSRPRPPAADQDDP